MTIIDSAIVKNVADGTVFVSGGFALVTTVLIPVAQLAVLVMTFIYFYARWRVIKKKKKK